MPVITGATGRLGRLVIEGLLKTVPADRITAAVRSPEKAADLADRGIEVRPADYDRPETLATALAGADTLLLISGSEFGRRIAQHTAVIEAAKTAGVRHIVYTSIPQADSSPLPLAADHKGTERAIRASGIPFTFLRNGWYSEGYVTHARQAIEHGVIIGSVGKGRIASAARADFAAAAVAVLTGEGHGGRAYELTGDVAWSFPELAETISRVIGAPVEYRDLTSEEHRQALIAAGLHEAVAAMYVEIDRYMSQGQGGIGDTTGDLRTLIGRPTTPITETLTAALRPA